MSIAGLKYYLSSRANMFDFFASRNMLNWMSDEAFLKRKFKLRMGYELDLDNPKTFNEKLQWLKLYDRNPLYTKLVDKYEVRKYIAEKIGVEVGHEAGRQPRKHDADAHAERPEHRYGGIFALAAETAQPPDAKPREQAECRRAEQGRKTEVRAQPHSAQ